MKIEKKHLLDYTILIPYLILSVVGLIVVYSTTSARLVTFGANPFASVMNQGAFWLVSLLFIFFIYRLKLNFLRKDKVLGAVIIVEIILLVVAKLYWVPYLSNQRNILRLLLFGIWRTPSQNNSLL